jgi:hypothetical protein
MRELNEEEIQLIDDLNSILIRMRKLHVKIRFMDDNLITQYVQSLQYLILSRPGLERYTEIKNS